MKDMAIEILELFGEAARARGYGRWSHLPYAFGELTIRGAPGAATKAERASRYYERLKADPRRYLILLARSAANCRNYYRRKADLAGRTRARCGSCGASGHNRRSCSRVATREDLHARRRELHARYRERNRENIRARQAAWEQARRATHKISPDRGAK